MGHQGTGTDDRVQHSAGCAVPTATPISICFRRILKTSPRKPFGVKHVLARQGRKRLNERLWESRTLSKYL